METITIYALQYSDDPFCAPYLKTIAISKEDAKATIERLHNRDSKKWNKGCVYITPYEIDLSTGALEEDVTLIGIKDLQ